MHLKLQLAAVNLGLQIDAGSSDQTDAVHTVIEQLQAIYGNR